MTALPAPSGVEVAAALAWDALAIELDCWRALGRRATLWWRDDDACEDTPALRRLLAIAHAARVPVAIAAIPATAGGSLVAAIDACPQATAVQHGYAHRNHASPGARSAELGDEREPAACLDELARGRARLERLLDGRFAAILVPPWNRAGERLLPALASAGFAGLSRFGPRATPEAAPGLRQVNAHADPVAWRRGRTFVGAASGVQRVIDHLRARRTGAADAAEPTGLLTHHLAFDDAAFAFTAELVARTCAHPGAAWLDVREAFA